MARVLSEKTEGMSSDEWSMRCELAACYRLFVRFGWTDLIFTHLSARVPGETNHYLINPYGLLFQEITASNLIKVDFDGEVIAGDYPYNGAGHAIHSAVLKARPDINVALHSHTRAGMAVSCMQEGLLPLTQQANEVRDMLCYHDYGIAEESNPEECEKLGRDMADKWLMIMRNHGLLSVGRTVGEAFYYLYELENACKVQVDVLASGAELIVPEPGVVDLMASNNTPMAEGLRDSVSRSWEALIRMLDEQEPNYKD